MYLSDLVSGFALTPWLASAGYTAPTPLTGLALQDLMELLQLSRFKADNCDQTSAPYVPRDSSGWNSGIAIIKILFIIMY